MQTLSATDNIEKEVTIGLEYFFNNFKAWNKSINARYDNKDISKFRSFESLLDYSLPTDLVTVKKTRNLAGSRFFNMGEIKIIRNDKGWPSEGAVFGLLLAYSFMKIKNISNDIRTTGRSADLVFNVILTQHFLPTYLPSYLPSYLPTYCSGVVNLAT